MRRLWNLVLANPTAAMKSPESLSPHFASLPEPPPESTAWSREFVDLLTDLESNSRADLDQVAALVAIRHVWPTYSALTMLREMRRELSRMQAPPVRRKTTQSTP